MATQVEQHSVVQLLHREAAHQLERADWLRRDSSGEAAWLHGSERRPGDRCRPERQPYFQKFGRIGRTASVQPLGTNRYDSMQAQLTKRYSSGLMMRASYTWSKALGICGVTNSDNEPCVRALDYYHLTENTVLSFDRTHNFQLNGLYELPFGQGKQWGTSGIAKALFGGWQINGLLSAYSGTPFNVERRAPASTCPAAANAPIR